nr:MFS transporter [Streptomyces albus]
MGVMCTGMFLVLLDVTVVNVALPSIGRSLGAASSGTTPGPGTGAGTGTVQWVVDAYAVAIAGLLLGAGAIGDRVGHRRVVLAGLALFGLASAGCALAPGSEVLVAARAVQGTGAALLLPGSLAVITDTFTDPAARARALGVWAGVSSLALPAGPLLGGALVGTVGWRMVFWVNLPVVAAALVAVARLVPGRGGRAGNRTDWLGTAGTALLPAAVVFAVIDAGHHGPRAVGACALAVAVVAGAGLSRAQRCAPAPVLPLPLLRRPAFAGPNIAALVMNAVANGTLFVTTLYLQSVQHRSPLAAGVALLPLFIPLALLAPVAGRLTARYGPRVPMVAGACAAACGCAALLFVRADSGIAVLTPGLAGLGTGAGLFTAAVVTAAVAAVPDDRSGLAGGVNNAARQTGTALGIAVFGAVAGSPDDPAAFTAALRHLGLLGAVLWAAVLALTAVTVPRGREAARETFPGETSPGQDSAASRHVPEQEFRRVPRRE